MVIQTDTRSRRGDGDKILGIINVRIQSGKRAVRKIRGAMSANGVGADLQMEMCDKEGALRRWRSGEIRGARRN